MIAGPPILVGLLAAINDSDNVCCHYLQKHEILPSHLEKAFSTKGGIPFHKMSNKITGKYCNSKENDIISRNRRGTRNQSRITIW